VSETVTENGNGTKALTRVQKTRQMLLSRRDEFATALAGRVDADVFVRIAHQAITKNPKLLECTEASMLMAINEAATLGLLPTGVLGEAYLVPQCNKGVWEVEFRPGFRGLVTLCRRSGGVVNILPATIHENEHHEIRLGSRRELVHTPILDQSKRGKPVIYYAVATLPGGITEFWYKSKADVDAVRKRSRTPDKGPWQTDFEPMAWKTVIREFVKYLPMDTHEIARALEADSRDYDLSKPAAPAAVNTLNRALADEADEDVQEAEYEVGEREPGADDE
jgi:recombination protein RecT